MAPHTCGRFRRCERSRPRALLFATAVAPASVEECEEIVERIARLELEKKTPQPQAISDEIEAPKKLARSTMKDCVASASLRCDALRRGPRAPADREECFD